METGLIYNTNKLNGGGKMIETYGDNIVLYEIWISTIGTIIQVIVAIILVVFTWSSNHIAKQQNDTTDKQTEILQVQINLALYERRFNLYQSLMTLISTALRKGRLTNDDLNEFWRSSREAKFLLDDELNSYMQEVQSRCIKFATFCNDETRTSSLGPDECLMKDDDEKTYFMGVVAEIPKRFEKYLGFNQVTLK